MFDRWGVPLVLFVLTDGKGMAYGGPPFPGTGCPVLDVTNIDLIWNL